MARDYKKEREKEKESKVSKLLKLDKKLNDEFNARLKEDGIAYSEWVSTRIKKYLKKW